MLGFLNAHFVVGISGSDAFPRNTIDGYRNRDCHDVADLFYVFDGMGPVRRDIIENVGYRMPLYIIYCLNISVAVAPPFTLFDKPRVSGVNTARTAA